MKIKLKKYDKVNKRIINLIWGEGSKNSYLGSCVIDSINAVSNAKINTFIFNEIYSKVYFFSERIISISHKACLKV